MFLYPAARLPIYFSTSFTKHGTTSGFNWYTANNIPDLNYRFMICFSRYNLYSSLTIAFSNGTTSATYQLFTNDTAMMQNTITPEYETFSASDYSDRYIKNNIGVCSELFIEYNDMTILHTPILAVFIQ